MLNEIDIMMSSIISGKHIDNKIKKLFDNMFVTWDDGKPERFGLHISDITVPFKGKGRFCFRQHVLGNFYVPAKSSQLSPKRIRVFLEGWYVHLKWQQLFKISGYAVEIENTRKDPLFNIYYTPDGILKIKELSDEKLWIAEIKSMNDSSYQKMLLSEDAYSIHPSGYKQSQMYMYLSGIKDAILILENKNNQEHRDISFEFEPEFVKPYVHRLNILSQLQTTYETEGKIPHKVCESVDSPRAKVCPMREVCWINRLDREKFRSNRTETNEQINASFFHERENSDAK